LEVLETMDMRRLAKRRLISEGKAVTQIPIPDPSLIQRGAAATSRLAMGLIHLVALGGLPDATVSYLSKLGAEDIENALRGTAQPQVVLRKIGTVKDKKNAASHVQRFYPTASRIEPYVRQIPLMHPGLKAMVDTDNALLFPHEQLASLYLTNRSKFFEAVGSLAEVKSWWECAQLETDPSYKDHPLRSRDCDECRNSTGRPCLAGCFRVSCYAWGMHIDGVPMLRHGKESILLLSHSSRMPSACARPSKDGLFPCGEVPSRYAEDITMDAFWPPFIHSFNQCYWGTFSGVDHKNKAWTDWRAELKDLHIAGGLWFAMTSIRCDFKEHVDTFHLKRPGHYKEHECCWDCYANQGPNAPPILSPFNFSEFGQVNCMPRPLAEFNAKPYVNPIYHIPGRQQGIIGVTRHTNKGDLYHMSPAGLGRYINGGIAESLVKPPRGRDAKTCGVLPGSTIGEREASFRIRLRAAYADKKVIASERLKKVERKKWNACASGSGLRNKFPEMRAKASVIKKMFTPLREIVESVGTNHANPTLQKYLKLRLRLVRGLEKLHVVTDREGPWLSDKAIRDLEKAITDICISNLWLSNFFMKRGQFAFYRSIKLHYLWHQKTLLRKTRFNPRFDWVARDEGSMGELGIIGRSCVRGAGALKMSYRFFQKVNMRSILRNTMMDVADVPLQGWAIY